MAISFVAAGTAFGRITSGTGFTFNKPSGVVADDLMIASVQFETNGSTRTVTLPSGWTQIKSVTHSDDDRMIQLVTAYRVAGGSEPSSWNGTISASVPLTACATTAYRGVQAVGLSGTSSTGVDTSYGTATLNNTVSNSWRVVCAAYLSGTTSYTISSNETTRRTLSAADDSGNTGACQSAIWDSAGTISTGNTSRTVSRSASWSCSASTILLLSPTTGTPATGPWASTLGKVAASASGEVANNGTMAATTPKVSSLADGFGQPPVGSGTMTSATPSVSASVSGAMDVSGSLSVVALPLVSIAAETRAFGVRVINVEADDRTIRVESRGVAD